MFQSYSSIIKKSRQKTPHCANSAHNLPFTSQWKIPIKPNSHTLRSTNRNFQACLCFIDNLLSKQLRRASHQRPRRINQRESASCNATMHATSRRATSPSRATSVCATKQTSFSSRPGLRISPLPTSRQLDTSAAHRMFPLADLPILLYKKVS